LINVIIGFPVLLILFIDYCDCKISRCSEENEMNLRIIFITDLRQPTSFIEKMTARLIMGVYNRISRRTRYVYDVSDIDGIIEAFRESQFQHKKMLILTDTMNRDYYVAKNIQEAMSSFQTKQKIHCVITNNVREVGSVIALSSNILSMDDYARLDNALLNSREFEFLLKRSRQYDSITILKQPHFLRLFSYYISTKVVNTDSLKQYIGNQIYPMHPHYYQLLDILKDQRYCLRK
jgi:hypothetical protein